MSGLLGDETKRFVERKCEQFVAGSNDPDVTVSRSSMMMWMKTMKVHRTTVAMLLMRMMMVLRTLCDSWQTIDVCR
jgi:hypothetical protein